MSVNNFVNDISKGIKNTPLNQELSPGSTPRRYEPTVGVRKHNERIHRESKYADEFKNLPYSFSKPYKPKGNGAYVKCDNCGHIIFASTTTVGMVCNNCKQFSSVTEVELDG